MSSATVYVATSPAITAEAKGCGVATIAQAHAPAKTTPPPRNDVPMHHQQSLCEVSLRLAYDADDAESVCSDSSTGSAESVESLIEQCAECGDGIPDEYCTPACSSIDHQHTDGAVTSLPGPADNYWESLGDLSTPRDDCELAEGAPARVKVKVHHRSGTAYWTTDTAADSIWMGKDEFMRYDGQNFRTTSSRALAADGSELAVIGTGQITFALWGRVFQQVPVKVMSRLPSGVLLGNKFIVAGLRLKADFGSERGAFTLPIASGAMRTYSGRIYRDDTAGDSEEAAVVVDTELDDAIAQLDLAEFGTQEEQEKLRALLQEYREVFVPTTAVAVGPDFTIKLKPDADTGRLFCPPFRQGPSEKATERSAIAELLARGVVEMSTSAHAANNVFVGKKPLPDGSPGGLRTTSDFRRLNSMTVGDAYPTEDAKQLVAWLATKRIFSVMDVRDGFWNCQMDEASRHLTAVRTVLGLIQYRMMPMGLKNSSAHFQRLINNVYAEIRWSGSEADKDATQAKLAAYQDDVSVGSDTPADHIDDLRVTLELTLRANLRFKLAKCLFGKKEVEILGHKVSHQRILPSDRHVEAMKNFREPTNASELLRFLGCLQFFANHIPDLSDHAKDLYDMLKGTKWNKKKKKSQPIQLPNWKEKWKEPQSEAFYRLREIISDPQFLVPPRPGAKKRLVTDASQYGLGVMLLQDEGDRGWLPLGFASRKLRGAEGRWVTSEKECAGVVFGLEKFRHFLYGEEFTVHTDHSALQWLMSLSDPKDRLARWMMTIQQFDFKVEYSAGDGELLVVPDALSRDTMDKQLTYCNRCLELVDDVTESQPAGMNPQKMREEQVKQFGELTSFAEKNDRYVVAEHQLLHRMETADDIRVVVPDSMVADVINHVHGSRAVGHWGVARTAARIRQRYWWSGWKQAVEEKVKSCLACTLGGARITRRQARMQKWHPSARFHTIAVDVLEISPESSSGCKKVVVIGDLFTRFMQAIPTKDETSETIAKVLFERWISVFGPPVRILSDQGKPFVSAVIKCLCQKVGSQKIFTSPYHPQTDGCVERFNRTLCDDLRKFVMDEENWDRHVSFAVFRYNCSKNSVTKSTPYRAMFGVDAFEFDAALGLQLRLEDEPIDLPARLAEIHNEVLRRGKTSRDSAAKYYNRSVKKCSYKEGDRVLLYHPPGTLEIGRKLRVPWLGPYRIVAVQSQVGYELLSEIGNRRARVHVNRLKRIAEDEDIRDTGDPQQGVWPDARRIIRSILGHRGEGSTLEYKLTSRGRNGYVWTKASEVPDVVRTAYDMAARERAMAVADADSHPDMPECIGTPSGLRASGVNMDARTDDDVKQ